MTPDYYYGHTNLGNCAHDIINRNVITGIGIVNNDNDAVEIRSHCALLVLSHCRHIYSVNRPRSGVARHNQTLLHGDDGSRLIVS